MTKWASQSRIRPRSASGEKPPKTTVWGAPSRAQASMATTVSGIIGMYEPNGRALLAVGPALTGYDGVTRAER
jgi:hypothetical protein